ncbi:MAG: ferrous iron transport protein B, partial [Spirochaetales bacterium]
EKKEGVFVHRSVEQMLVTPFVTPGDHTTRKASAVVGKSHGREIRVVDLPGIYTMAASSEDEAVARDFLLSGDVDLVVNVVDASNMQRNIYLTLQLLEMRIPVLVVLNMVDVAEKKGITVNVPHLSEHLECPVIAVSAVNASDFPGIKDAILKYAESATASQVRVTYPQPVEDAIAALGEHVAVLSSMLRADAHWIGLKVLEGDPWVETRLTENSSIDAEEIERRRAALHTELGDELDIVIADAKYGFIHGLSVHVTREKLTRTTLTERIDRVVMNRLLALPIFFVIMYGVFWLTMNVGGAFVDFFDQSLGVIFVDGLGSLLRTWGAPDWVSLIVAGGIGNGIQTVGTFIPIIFTMFAALSILEDSGYMARAAYVMDRFMRAIGLPGKSFVPMMVGFGCTVPAIMGARTLESKRDRFMTIFMAPNMSCGARLPVYALFAAAFFPKNSGAVVFSLYLAGIVVAVGTGFLLKYTLFRGDPSHFIMELPPYHVPRASYVFGQAWHRRQAFILRAGATITVMVTVLSVLNSVGLSGAGETGEASGPPAASETVLATVARSITPILEPMGVEADNWPATVALVTGIFAKEAVVGTLNSLYLQASLGDDQSFSGLGPGITAALRTIPRNVAAIFGAGAPGNADEAGNEHILFSRLRDHFSSRGAYAYLLMVLIYVPCVAALATAIREMGAVLGMILAAYSTILAWCVATAFYQITAGPSVTLLIPLGIFLAIVGVLRLLGSTVYSPEKLEKTG